MSEGGQMGIKQKHHRAGGLWGMELEAALCYVVAMLTELPYSGADGDKRRTK